VLFGRRRGSYPPRSWGELKSRRPCFAADGGLGRWANRSTILLGGAANLPSVGVGSRRLFYEVTDIHFTVMVIFFDTTGGLNG
jgi:hypothetical protein